MLPALGCRAARSLASEEKNYVVGCWLLMPVRGHLRTRFDAIALRSLIGVIPVPAGTTNGFQEDT